MIQNLGKYILFCMALSLSLNAKSSYSIKLSKESSFVSEAILCTLSLVYSTDDNITKIKDYSMVVKDFWIEEVNSTITTKNNMTVRKQNYLLFPQINGLITIPSQTIDIVRKDVKTYRNIWSKLSTEKIDFIVTKLPNGVDAVGNFAISMEIDKNTTLQNAPVNLKVIIKGDGNLNDAKPLVVALSNQQVYANSPNIKSVFKTGKYSSVYTQNFTIISNSDYEIPKLSFKFLDSRTMKTKEIYTSPIAITIADKRFDFTALINILYGTTGLALGSIFTIMYIRFSRKKVKGTSSLRNAIKNSRNNKELYGVLLPYSKELRDTRYISDLESNLYKDKKIKINKRDIIKHLEIHWISL